MCVFKLKFNFFYLGEERKSLIRKNKEIEILYVIDGLENRFLSRCFTTSSYFSNDTMRKENNEKSTAKVFWKSTIESLIFVANLIFS